jgi:ubiquitin-conjugating enzyme E2 J2
MATSTSTHRLRKELRNISRSPPQHITARPLASNILHWYFVLEGPPDSAYAGGLYLGRLCFPAQYPFKPPAVYMCTPQGRFVTEQKLCLSMSDFHPETWNPLWSVSAVLTGLLTFMLLDEETVGSITTSTAEKRALARSSHTFNRGSKIYRDLFPEYLADTFAPASSGKVSKSAAAGAASVAAVLPDAGSSATDHPSTAHSKQGAPRRPAAAADTNGRKPRLQNDANHVVNARNKAVRRGNIQDKESLPSLLAWLVILCGVLFAIVRLISSP